MRLLIWPRDSIARRIALTIALVIIVAVVCVRLLFLFGREWIEPEMELSSMVGEVAATIRLVDAAPPPLRQTLTRTVSTSNFRADWSDVGAPDAVALGQLTPPKHGPSLLGRLLGNQYPAVVAFKPGDSVAMIPAFSRDRDQYPESYFLAVKLSDQSWLVFTAFKRIWGLDREQRWIVWAIFSALITIIASVLAARQLSRPVRQLAEAARLFGLNPQSPPVPESGPQELRQVIKTFNAMQAQIQKFLAYRTTMLAAISHDLRTPLTRMRLRGEYIEDAEQQARLFRDVDEMQAMIDGALSFFRDDAAEEATTTFDLPGVLRTILNDYADQDIEITYNGPAHAIYQGRPFALKRAFANLVENAIKYATPPEITLTSTDQAYIVSIRDHGPGIPPDALDRVFSPYYRLDKSRNRSTGGVGLGLTSAQAIIHGHGGEISLDNRPGGGLEACVTLPRIGEGATV